MSKTDGLRKIYVQCGVLGPRQGNIMSCPATNDGVKSIKPQTSREHTRCCSAYSPPHWTSLALSTAHWPRTPNLRSVHPPSTATGTEYVSPPKSNQTAAPPPLSTASQWYHPRSSFFPFFLFSASRANVATQDTAGEAYKLGVVCNDNVADVQCCLVRGQCGIGSGGAATTGILRRGRYRDRDS